MDNSIVKRFLAAMFLVAAFAAPALADADYYIELGQDTTQDGAEAQWDELVAKHKTLLKNLHFFPKSVIASGAAVGTRIQAGPIASKSKAQKICAKLFTNDIPCFVIEGVGDAPPTEMMNLSEKADGRPTNSRLPWLEPSEIQGTPPVQGSTLPWLMGDRHEGKVQVAEAIRVPLTDRVKPDAGQVTVKSLPELKPTFRPQAAEDKSVASSGDVAGWLTVDTFLNEDVATSFWGEVRGGLPKDMKKLRVRVKRPLMDDGKQARTSLMIGPFAGGAQAQNFCQVIQAQERGLNCHYGDTATASLSSVAPAAGPSKQYWVQVVSAASQMEALRRWERMKANNADLLGKMRSSVAMSPRDRKNFVVRVGPIVENNDAVRLCAELQGRDIDCQVLLYSAGL